MAEKRVEDTSIVKASPPVADDIPIAQSNPEEQAVGKSAFDIPEEIAEPQELLTCKSCQRKMNPRAMKTHAKICKKVNTV